MHVTSASPVAFSARWLVLSAVGAQVGQSQTSSCLAVHDEEKLWLMLSRHEPLGLAHMVVFLYIGMYIQQGTHPLPWAIHFTLRHCWLCNCSRGCAGWCWRGCQRFTGAQGCDRQHDQWDL